MKFERILEKYRKFSFSERDKGARFERLMQAYLQTEPIYAGRFKHVWLWEEFPYRKDFGGKDTGIDLVAQTHVGDYWAIQCKCYSEDTYIDKPAVDSFISTSSRTFTNESLQKTTFTNRLWISTTNKWGSNAEESIHNQHPPVSRISLSDLAQSPVDWEALEKGICGDKALSKKKTIRPHQKEALDNFHEHFKVANRGRLIMACGTGKTFTSLKIAEHETDGKGLILFLVPSIALLGQTLREWSAEANEPLNPICICSDTGVSQKKVKNDDTDGFSVEDLALPASTNVQSILKQFQEYKAHPKGGMTVVFSTYQSIEVISKVQGMLNKEKAGSFVFDLIICDEAHRTTGITLQDEDDSDFVKVHENSFLQAKKRIYMTATPRLYSEDNQKKAKEADAYLCSMDDVVIYGEEVYRFGFGEAVDKQLLSDYKVLVLTLSEDQIPESLQKAIADKTQEINTDDASKLIGCINALSKRMLLDAELLRESDPSPMRRALAFCQSIKVSKKITNIFNTQKDAYYDSLTAEERTQVVSVESDHIDGTMGAATRDDKLAWLKSAPQDGNECRILTNVRCLSEGVDVPSLDAVMFLSARNSQVDVVQSVGRVMRKAPDKKYGYIIIPVVVPANVKPEDALDDNERFKVVWTVLNALRAHDDRFNAMINKLELNKKKPAKKLGGGTVLVGGLPPSNGGTDGESGEKLSEELQKQFLLQFEQLQSVIYARMVKKVGDKRYWEQWAVSVADIAKRHIERIKKLISQEGEHQRTFQNFLEGLRKNINPSISEPDAIEMLAQHIITKPVFEALFENYSFVKNNPISVSMQKMIDLLEEQSLEKDQEVLERFYESVKMRASGIDNAEGRQRIIIELYDKFFKTAFRKVVEKLGIVYTPVEVVDFIIHSVEAVLQKEFGRSISDENIHVLDPFTGTGTFISRLLQSGLINKKDIVRKYQYELHANEIVLLAYYIASINIENVFHDLLERKDEYKPFEGICLTDTFQLAETDSYQLEKMFPENSKRITAQKKAPIRVIVGNPPYSVGQKSANDNSQNSFYPTLNSRIESTYASLSDSTLNKQLYDSYIKAFRWASDRLENVNGGVIAFVSNAGWLDGSSMAGFRKSIEIEFSDIFVLNLRGNCNLSGVVRKKEGDNIFGMGTKTPVAITLLIKRANAINDRAVIHYYDIGDYLKKEEKLSILSNLHDISSNEINWSIIHPNKEGDWLNQRNDVFATYIPLEPVSKFNIKSNTFFILNAIGMATNRDDWIYNFSKEYLLTNIESMINFYNSQLALYIRDEAESKKNNSEVDISKYTITGSDKIKWTRALRVDFSKRHKHVFNQHLTTQAIYRPFCKQMIYFDKSFIESPGLNSKLIPNSSCMNLIICISGQTSLITDCMPDLHFAGDSQCFPLYYYEESDEKQASLYDEQSDKYIRRDAISDFIYNLARESYGGKVTKEDIFYYVYGFLHCPTYRERYSADLKKILPRIPLVAEPKDFWAFSKAGRALADLHINYETVEPYPLKEVGSGKSLLVEKMRFPSKQDKTSIIYNNSLTLQGIPLDAYEYVVNGRSAIEWIMERYQVKVDKDSGIKNDPNDWCVEVGDPRYIVDLVKRIVRVSLETMKIVKALPTWEPEK